MTSGERKKKLKIKIIVTVSVVVVVFVAALICLSVFGRVKVNGVYLSNRNLKEDFQNKIMSTHTVFMEDKYNKFTKFKYDFKPVEDRNIFVIHQLGVSLVNDNFTEIISNEVVFNESDQINSEEDLSKVESVIGESHIICLIKKKFLPIWRKVK